MTATTTTPKTFLLGGELEVHRLGYGAMRLTGQPGNYGPYADWEGGKALLRRAAELGVDFLDSAYSYGPRTSEALIGEAFAGRPQRPVFATKGGVDKPAPGRIEVDGSPATLRAQVEESLRSLQVERIDLYQLHRPDPKVPLEESMGALADLQREGKVRFLGISNVDLEQYEEARRAAPIASVQNRFNLGSRAGRALVERTRADGVAFIPYAPLGAKGFVPGSPLAADDGPAAPLASALGLTPGQLVLAWLLAVSPNTIVIPATTSLVHLEENVAALDVNLSRDQATDLERAFALHDPEQDQ